MEQRSLIVGIHELAVKHKANLDLLDKAIEKHKTIINELRVVEEAAAIVQDVAASVQKHAHQKIAEIVTSCLKAVFPDKDYQFRIKFEKMRGRTEARLRLVEHGQEISPLGGVGFGEIDVAAFALRVACLCLSRPPRRRLIVSDEPFRHLSSQRRENVAAMIEWLAEELRIQFILTTHSKELEIGHVITL